MTACPINGLTSWGSSSKHTGLIFVNILCGKDLCISQRGMLFLCKSYVVHSYHWDTADELIASIESVSGWWASLRGKLLQWLWLLVGPLLILLLLRSFRLASSTYSLTQFISSCLEASNLQMVLNMEPSMDLWDLPIYLGPLDHPLTY